MNLRIAEELSVAARQVSAAVDLLDGGATVPFIARYRKEVTGGLDDAQLRTLEERLRYLRELEERRDAILRSHRAGQADRRAAAQIRAADAKARLEDLYLPYKPKRRTKAQIAREAGLEPLADLLLGDPGQDPQHAAAASSTRQRRRRRRRARRRARHPGRAVRRGRRPDRRAARGDGGPRPLISKVREGQEEAGAKFADYFDFSEPFARLPAHRVLALFRGEKEEVLDLILDPGADDAANLSSASPSAFGIATTAVPADPWLGATVRWAWRTRILTHLSVDLRVRLWQAAEDEAVRVFAANLRDLLLAAPAGRAGHHRPGPGLPHRRQGRGGRRHRQGGRHRDHLPARAAPPLGRVARHPGQAGAAAPGRADRHRQRHRLAGDRQAGRRPDQAAPGAQADQGRGLRGRRVASTPRRPTPRRELPELDVTLRGAVSIARRLQDPLAELVKIDPKSIGVGQYQHDVTEGKLSRSLDAVVEDCVNAVGVDLNTASEPLLARVSGITAGLATAIVAHRDANGPFSTRKQLMQVPRLGPKAFEQCAGFLRIRGGDDPLDASAVHPEAYPVVRRILAATGTAAGAADRQHRDAARAEARAVRRRPVRPADRHRHPARAGEARPRPAPRVRHRDVRRGRRDARGPAARHGAGGRGDQRGRVRRVRRRRRAPGRPGARLGHVAQLRHRPARGGQVRRRGAGEGAVGRRPRHRISLTLRLDDEPPAAGGRPGRRPRRAGRPRTGRQDRPAQDRPDQDRPAHGTTRPAPAYRPSGALLRCPGRGLAPPGPSPAHR